ncbi:glycoside hydrolase family 32 protein [Enterococcus sp. LJL99]
MRTTVEQANNFIAENKERVNELYRHHYHLMAPIGWINDPNGFVYFKGEYHLFYQFYPYDSVWGPMHWGHAKSKDLVQWEDLPVALAPTEEYEADGCFSGSAIEKDGKLYLMYTGHYERNGIKKEVQCMAVSEDGIHFEKYAGNPVIAEPHIKGIAAIEDFRDPKVFQKDDVYYSVVASKTEDERGQILLFQSNDLLNWMFKSVLLEGKAHQGIMWECPDLFQLDGKDVLLMSPIEMQREGNAYHNMNSTVAFIGMVDWTTGKLTVDNYHEIDSGLDFYAPQTCLDAQNRRIMVAWMQMWARNMPTNDLGHLWAGAMTLPRELSIEQNQLVQKPIQSIYSFIQNEKNIQEKELTNATLLCEGLTTDASYLKFVATIKEAQQVTFEIAKSENEFVLVNYDVAEELLSISRAMVGDTITGSEVEHLDTRKVKVPLKSDQLHLEFFRDTSSIEIFTDGPVTMTMNFYKKESSDNWTVSSLGTIKDISISYGEIG